MCICALTSELIVVWDQMNSQNQFTLLRHIASVNSIVLITDITPTNYSVDSIAKNDTLRPFTIINCQTVYYLGRRD